MEDRVESCLFLKLDSAQILIRRARLDVFDIEVAILFLNDESVTR